MSFEEWAKRCITWGIFNAERERIPNGGGSPGEPGPSTMSDSLNWRNNKIESSLGPEGTRGKKKYTGEKTHDE